jgi:hypothetical protein
MVDAYACILALIVMMAVTNRSGIVTPLPFATGPVLLHGVGPSLAPHRALLLPKPEMPPARTGLFLSTRNITFPGTGSGYYRDTTITIVNGSPGKTTVRILSAGDESQFTVGATTLQISDSTPTPLPLRFHPTTPDSCYTLTLVIDGGTALDTVFISGCALDIPRPFDTGMVDFGNVTIGSLRTVTDTLEALRTDSVAYTFSLLHGGPFNITQPPNWSTVVYPRTRSSLTLTFRPTAITGLPYRDTLLCRTSIGERLIVLQGNAVDPVIDSAALSTNTLDFGDLYLGTSRDSTVMVVNNYSGETLQVTQRLDTGVFSAQPQSFQLRPGERRNITVTFTPTVAGPYAEVDSIFFRHTGDSTETSQSIVLAGRGVAALIRSDHDSVVIDSLIPGFCDSTSAGDTEIVVLKNDGNITATVTAQLASGTQGFTLRSSAFFRIDSIFTIIVGFCGNDSTAATDVLTLYDLRDASKPIMRIPLIHHATRKDDPPVNDSLAIIRMQTGTLDFDELALNLPVGTRRTVMISNDGSAGAIVDIDTFLPVGGLKSTAFSIISPTARPVIVPAHDSVLVTIEFRPTIAGRNLALWRVGWHDEDSSRTLVLTGWGKPTSSRSASFGNAHERVGRPIRLALVLSPDSIPGTHLSWDSAVVIIDPNAFLLTAVEPAGLTVERGRDDSAIILRRPAGSAPVRSDSLLTLVLMGLTTGRPVNEITIDTVYSATPIASGPKGIVQLDGCDVGRGIGSSLKPAVSELAIDPGGTSASLSYSAAEGAIPTITLVSVNGSVIIGRDLPPGSGSVQSAAISLRDVPPGLYWLVLRVESDRVVTPLMITR